jgi:hypothetical protein
VPQKATPIEKVFRNKSKEDQLLLANVIRHHRGIWDELND